MYPLAPKEYYYSDFGFFFRVSSEGPSPLCRCTSSLGLDPLNGCLERSADDVDAWGLLRHRLPALFRHFAPFATPQFSFHLCARGPAGARWSAPSSVHCLLALPVAGARGGSLGVGTRQQHFVRHPVQARGGSQLHKLQLQELQRRRQREKGTRSCRELPLLWNSSKPQSTRNANWSL